MQIAASPKPPPRRRNSCASEHEDACPGTADGMTDGDRPTVWIHLLGIELRPVVQAGERLRGKGLIELDHREVLPPDSGTLERGVGGRDRSDPVQRRLDGADASRDDSGERRAIRAASTGSIREQDRGSTVVERGCVARGHRAVGSERRTQRGERVDGRSGANAFVAAKLHPLHRDHLAVVASRIPRRSRPAMAAQREAVLLLTADRILRGKQLRALPEREGPVRGHARVDHAPAQRRREERLVGARVPAFRLEQHPGRAAHQLDPACDAE